MGFIKYWWYYFFSFNVYKTVFPVALHYGQTMGKTLNFIIYQWNNNIPITIDQANLSFDSNLSQTIFILSHIIILKWAYPIIFKCGNYFTFMIYKTNFVFFTGGNFIRKNSFK